MKMDVLKFDNGLIGIPFDNGFRIKLNKSDCKFNQMNIINHFSNLYGEGYYIKNTDQYQSKEWTYLETKHQHIIVINDDIDKLRNFCYRFKINYDYNDIDESQTIEMKINNILEKYLFEPITYKLKNKIREDLRKEFNIKPFNIKFNSGIEIYNLFDNENIVKIKIEGL